MKGDLVAMSKRLVPAVAALAVVAVAGWMVGGLYPSAAGVRAVADVSADVSSIDKMGPWPPKISVTRVLDGGREIGEVLINESVALALSATSPEYTPYERAVVVAERLKLQIKPRENMTITTGLRDGVHVVLVNDAAIVTPLPDDLPEGITLDEGARLWASDLAAALEISLVQPDLPEPWEVDEPYTDKIVPILSVGKGKRIGGARVNGPTSRVNQTQAVVQLEAKMLKWFRVQIYVPVSTKVPGKSFDRVQGVAVTAVGDLKLFILIAIGVFAVSMMVGAGRNTADRAVAGILDSVIKGGVVTIAVMEFADELDDGINDLLRQRGLEVQGMTKVVPVIRLGGRGGTQAGAAQVVGPAEQVEKVQAVAEFELRLGMLRGRALIPVATKNPLKGKVKGVSGVGVNASIKVRI